MYALGSAGSTGTGASTTGLGLRSQPREACSRCSRLRTLVKYWSSRSRSRGADGALQLLGVAGDGVEDAFAGFELADLGLDLVGGALDEQLPEHLGRLVLRRNGDAGAGARQAARARVDGQRERREARERADALGDVLVERDGVAKRAAARVRRAGEEADVGRVAAIDVGMRHAAEDGEVFAMLLQQLQVRRGRVVAAGAGWQEVLAQQAEIVADGEHPSRRGAGPRGRSLLRARANAGVMASRNGRARATPVPRRK